MKMSRKKATTYIGLLSQILFVLFFSACSVKSQDRVIPVNGDDQEMNDAIQLARETVGTFIRYIQAPKPTQDFFFVKAIIMDGENIEHMWLNTITYDGHFFYGYIANDPIIVTNVKPGDQVKVLPSDISDWMFTEDGKLIGGYTIKVLRDRMSPEERVEYDQKVWFTIENP